MPTVDEPGRGLAGRLTGMRLLLLAAALSLGTAGARILRELPWALAGLVGLALAVLLGMTFRTLDQLRGFWRTEEERRELLRRRRSAAPPRSER